MKKNKVTAVSVLLVVLLFGAVSPAWAMPVHPDGPPQALVNILTGLTDMVQQMAPYLAIFGFVLYGASYLVSSFMPELAQQARGYLKNAIIGFVFIFGASYFVEWLVSLIAQ